ncbi:hypothetical protein [Nonomuraea sp. NPDC050310]|uniref:hypothetical protein n=1 Tax=unclassified Nonomuraea TaxID=2593643 RepID=UPI0033FF62B1
MGDHDPYHPSHEAPTTPFRRIVVPQETPQAPPRPVPAPRPPKRKLGDVPIRTVYLVVAVVVTVLAVVAVFALFSGDQPDNQPITTAAAPQATAAATPAPTGVVAAEPPAELALPKPEGKATKVVGSFTDKNTLLTYPRLGKPWDARSYSPFSIAQRIGEKARPHTVIGSAMVPVEVSAKPSGDADYREIAYRATRWAARTHLPDGAVIAWTGSQKPAKGKGWVLGFTATYPGGSSQGVVAVIEVGKAKPAMLLATVPDTRPDQQPDLYTLVKGLRKT